MITPGFEGVQTDKEVKTDARKVGLKDGFLVIIFTSLSTLVVQLGDFLLANQTSINLGKYDWLKPLLVIILTTILKSVDRTKHEDPTTASTGLVKL